MWIYHDFTVAVQNHDKTTLPFRICFVLFRFALGSRGLLGVGGLWGIGDPSQIFCAAAHGPRAADQVTTANSFALALQTFQVTFLTCQTGVPF